MEDKSNVEKDERRAERKNRQRAERGQVLKETAVVFADKKLSKLKRGDRKKDERAD